MTCYLIQLGYNSGFSRRTGSETAWDTVKNLATVIRNNPDAIAAEVMRVEDARKDELAEHCERFATDKDLTIMENAIMLLASGGGRARRLKEMTRRAFCRLLIGRAHALGIEVNLTVS